MGWGAPAPKLAPCPLAAARARVRAVAATMAANLTIYLRGGVYQLTSPIEIGPMDSGRNGFTVTWKAYPGEEPILSGARTITGWTPVDGASWHLPSARCGPPDPAPVGERDAGRASPGTDRPARPRPHRPGFQQSACRHGWLAQHPRHRDRGAPALEGLPLPGRPHHQHRDPGAATLLDQRDPARRTTVRSGQLDRECLRIAGRVGRVVPRPRRRGNLFQTPGGDEHGPGPGGRARPGGSAARTRRPRRPVARPGVRGAHLLPRNLAPAERTRGLRRPAGGVLPDRHSALVGQHRPATGRGRRTSARPPAAST